jgi:antitoxin ChpS
VPVESAHPTSSGLCFARRQLNLLEYTTHLGKAGGSIMLAVSPAILTTLDLRPGDKLGSAVQSGRLVVEPQERPRDTLDELLAQCSPGDRRSEEERERFDDIPRGEEPDFDALRDREDFQKMVAGQQARKKATAATKEAESK